ncbi:MAG TPA: efflux RND transporter periplasmic adaptor subunit [Casimicrobiaceae bacterium]|nr:efflux RND transporter periplasmic adaptor subunit [Casimicrobiaceae bacterium]
MTRAAAVRFAVAVSSAALVFALAGCGKEGKQAPAAPHPSVAVMNVVPRDVPQSAVYIAQTQSSQAVNIQARVSGFLDKRMYTEGSMVKAGTVLFEMDKKPFQAQVDAAAAALQRDQAALEVAKANLARTRPLTELNALSQKDLDDAQGRYEQAAAAVEQAKAQLIEAKLNLSYTTIVSPVTGITGSAVVPEGTYVNVTNSQLTTVSVLSPMWIDFSVSENQIERIRDDVAKGRIRLPAQGSFVVEIEMADGKRFPYTGRITFADPSYNPRTGTFLIRASVQNPEGVLRPNQYVRARLLGAFRPNAILVPQRAVQQGAQGRFVWVVGADGKVQPRPVVVGDWYGDSWFINEGLSAGDRVVVDGTLRLAPGVQVDAVPYAPPPSDAAPAPPAGAGVAR